MIYFVLSLLTIYCVHLHIQNVKLSRENGQLQLQLVKLTLHATALKSEIAAVRANLTNALTEVAELVGKIITYESYIPPAPLDPVEKQEGNVIHLKQVRTIDHAKSNQPPDAG